MKPILFNTEMVRAILDGRKTVTRRLIKPQLPQDITKIYNVDPIGYLMFKTNSRLLDGWENRKAPYCKDEILYVRETFLPYDHDHVIDGKKYVYKADATITSEDIRKEFGYKWKPSIHMPKEAARIFLRVTDVRVERLQKANYFDFLAEGLPYKQYEKDLQSDFVLLWNSTIPKQDLDKYGFDANPWVWVYEFERVTEE